MTLHTAALDAGSLDWTRAFPRCSPIYRMTGGISGAHVLACNFGRDADSIARMVRALVGARHGLDVIPEAGCSRSGSQRGSVLKLPPTKTLSTWRKPW